MFRHPRRPCWQNIPTAANFSFNPRDLKILPKVVTSKLNVNIQQLDLIIGELNKIKKAMVQAQGARDAAGREAA